MGESDCVGHVAQSVCESISGQMCVSEWEQICIWII